MTKPSRRRGFRSLRVGALGFDWKFSPGPERSHLSVRSAEGGRIELELYDWRDPWLNVSGFRLVDGYLQLESSVQNDPAIVTPRFVRAAVDFACAAGGGSRKSEPNRSGKSELPRRRERS